MDIYLTKDDQGRFLPAFNTDHDLSKKIKTGEIVKVAMTRPRNPGFHRKFMAMIKMFHDNLPEELDNQIPTFNNMLDVVKVLAGHYTILHFPDGTISKVPKSISFGSMDDLEFEEFYSKSLDVGLKHFLIGMDPRELENEILNFM